MRILLVLIVLLLSGPALAADRLAHAMFAGGNFWSLQYAFAHVRGVDHTIAGYTGGIIANPSYTQVAKGDTGHRLAVMVFYDPRIITYEQLLVIYWHNIDPLDAKGQFCDRGPQYTTAIYYETDAQRYAAFQSKSLVEADSARMNDQRAAPVIMPAGAFYPAEGHHQGYFDKNPLRFKFYRNRCGRDQRLFDIWGKAHDGN
jgi:peptide-methionine (S)-S-oxide reductase